MVPQSDKPVVSTETRASQGVKLGAMRYVLGFSLAGVIIAFVIIYLV